MGRGIDVALLKLGGLLERFEGQSSAALPEHTGPQLLANRYRMRSVLGEGGMGRVLLVEDTVERRDVAMKITLASANKGLTDVGFRQEFYTLTKLQHPGTVKVHDYGTLPGGDRYLTMEYVRGADLRDLLTRGPRPIAEVTKALVELAQVLEFIHSRRFVHCDIKAENVRLTERQAVKLIDFGLMLPLGAPSDGKLRGTPAYMAPEIPRGGIIDARTDLYALGVLGFELLTGRQPFHGKSLTELITAHLEAPIPSARQLRPEVPVALDEVITRCLAKSASDRFSDMGDFLQALQRAVGVRVQSQSVSQHTSYLASVELLGREVELKGLNAALAAAREGHGSSVYVAAPAGVGKSRLIQEFLLAAKLADLPSVLGQCRPEGLAPMRPIAQALEQLLSVTPEAMLREVAAPFVKLIPSLATRGLSAPSYDDATAEKAAQVAALVSWLGRVSREVCPVVLVLEDLHWADIATLEALNLVARELSNTRVMLVGTFRPNEVDRSSILFNPVDAGTTRLLEVPPLTNADIERMVQAMLRGSALPEQFTSALATTTRGNPFFTTETLRALIERGAVQKSTSGWSVTSTDLALPASIEAAVTERLRAVDPVLLSLVSVAAVGGRVIDVAALEQISGLSGDALFAQLDAMIDRQFIARVDERLLFTHDTVRESVYGQLEQKRRAELHLAFGQYLEAGKTAGVTTLAHHFQRSSNRPHAIGYLLASADEALKVRALSDAAQRFVDASSLLDETPDYPNRAALQVAAWASIVDCTFSSRPRLTLEYGSRLIAHWRGAIDPLKAAGMMRGMMSVVNRMPRGVRSLIKGNIYKARALDAKTRLPFIVLPQMLQYLTLMAFAHAFISQFEPALEKLDEVGTLVPDPESIFFAGNRAAYGLVYGLRGSIPECKEKIDIAYAVAQRNLDTVKMPQTFQIYGNCLLLGPIAQAFGGERLDQRRVDEALTFAEAKGVLELVFQARWPGHVRACLAGEPDEYKRAFTELADIVRRMGFPPFFESRVYLWDPLFHLNRGEFEAAERGIGRLERMAAQLDDPGATAQAIMFRAMASLGARDGATALKHAEEALTMSKAVGSFVMPWAWFARAEALVLKRDVPQARAVIENELLPYIETPAYAVPVTQVITRRLHGEVLGGAAGKTSIETSLAMARTHGMGLHEGLGLFSLGRACVKDEPARAQRSFNEAVQVFERLDNRHHADRVRDALTRLALGQPA